MGRSQLYKDWDSAILGDVRQDFQASILARDGYPAKLGANDRLLNMRQVLASAKNVMDKNQYTKLKAQVETAMTNTSIE